ncbi:MAG: thioredoxin, partial [Mailhella sp.]
MGYPTIYPTGVTLYNPEKAWNGYTVFPLENDGSLLIDMNGNEIRKWKNLHGFPVKLFPGGRLIASSGMRNPKYGLQDQRDLIQVDFDGHVEWQWNQAEFITDPGEKPQWMARQHHDFQREG